MATESLSIFYWEPVVAQWDEGRIYKTLRTPFEAGYVQTRNKWKRPVYFFKLEFSPYPETVWSEVEAMLDFYDAVLQSTDQRFYLPSWHYEARFNLAYATGIATISVNNITRFVSTPGKPGNYAALIRFSGTSVQTLEVKQITGVNSPYLSFAAGDTTVNTYTIYDYVMRAYKVKFGDSNLNRKNILDHLYNITFLFEEAL